VKQEEDVRQMEQEEDVRQVQQEEDVCPDGARRRCTPKGFKGDANLLSDTTSESIA